MSNTQHELELARDAVGNVPANHLSAYVNIMGLRKLYAEKEPGFRLCITIHPAPTPLVIGNSISRTFCEVKSASAEEFLKIKQALEYAETLPEVIEALAIIEPLMGEIARLEEKLLEERAAYAVKLHAITAAEEAVLEKARLVLEKDSSLAKLRAEAEAARPPHIEPPPFRGKAELTIKAATA